MHQRQVAAGMNGADGGDPPCAQSAAVYLTGIRTRRLSPFRCIEHQERGTKLERPRCSTSPSEPCNCQSSFEVALSTFPFVLPVEASFCFHPSDALFTAGARIASSGESQRNPMLAAADNISEMAAELALEMGELRRSGQRLAQLLPGGTGPWYLGSSEGPSRKEGGKCRRRGSTRNVLPTCTEGDPRLISAEQWCDCVATVAASIESSMLSVSYEQEALQLPHQDLLDTKFQWWRAVKTDFTRGTLLGTTNPSLSQATRHKRHRPPGELCTPDTQKERLLPGSVMAYKATPGHVPLQRWASCCFRSPVSLAYLAKAHHQLYYVSDVTWMSLQNVSPCGRIGPEIKGTLPNRGAHRPDTDAEGIERGDHNERLKLGIPSVPNISHKAEKGLLEPKPTVADKATDTELSDAPQLPAFRGDAEKRRQIWEWIWEAAGALGFCASSRFLAMQLLDAYLQEAECTVEISKTVQVATAAVAAVLLAAASRCHWENMRDDAFLIALLEQLELPSTVDDVIQLQADMLRLLPSFLFSRRSPVDFLVCFLSNLQWLPQVLEHSSAVAMACEPAPGCKSAARGLISTEADASQKGLSANRCAPAQPLTSARSGSLSGRRLPEGGFHARKHTGGEMRWHASRGKYGSFDVQPRACGAAVASSTRLRDKAPVLPAYASSLAHKPEKKAVSLFEYWRFTGLLGCLEGLMLRCCSAFVASATLCTRVPMSRLLAVLLLEVFEPYSWHRLRRLDRRASVTSLGNSFSGTKVGLCDESDKRSERTKLFESFSGGDWPVILLQWYRYVSVSVFRMHFDADLSFWKHLLQPLTDQLLHLPENRPFLLLWMRGAEEWATLLKRCSQKVFVQAG